MTSPDYKIIDACLENVVRPEKQWVPPDCIDPWTLKLHRLDSDAWSWQSEDGQLRVHCSDALAAVEKAVSEWLCERLQETPLEQRKWKGRGIVEWDFYCTDDEGKVVAAAHSDRTTALCLLALRVAGKESQ